jgi:hypothetical protein
MSTIAAIICIILGLIVAIAKVDILFSPLVWFVLALAFEHLALPAIGPFVVRKEA